MHQSLTTLLLVFVMTLMLAPRAGGRVTGGKPAVYRHWPSCKSDTEFVSVIKKEDRRPGEMYHERVSKGGIKTYFCLPCTQCASGVRKLQPCSVHRDTVCSPAECEVAGCTMDENLYACRLPGDPNDFPSISAMMDPCDPQKVSVTPSSIKDLPPLVSFTPGSPQIVQQKVGKTASPQQNLPPRESFSTDRNTRHLSDLHEALLFVIAVVALFTFVIVLAVAVVCFRKFRKDGFGKTQNTHNLIGTNV